MSNIKRCYDLLRENDDKTYNEACDVLSRLCKNVIKNPKEIKYRKVRLNNPIVAEKLLPAIGAMECLFEIGFIEKDDHLFLPENSSLINLQELQHLLTETRSNENQSKPLTTQQTTSTVQSSSVDHRTATSLIVPSSSGNLINAKPTSDETKFFQQIRGHFQDVLKYENVELQNKTKSVIPLIELQINAMEKMRSIQREIKSNGDGKSLENITMEDLIFVELLKWFKEKFFQWVDSPDCTKCSANCSLQRVIPSNNPGISRIEVHRCSICATIVEFPRYSDPAFLLHSRKGRCGEWANMFALICRSLGYDTRLVWDYTDHVWVEIWSITENRWIHADPCENIMDRPLMYEKGWGKKLSYILAFSKDEIQDVTWRYTCDQKAVMKRRKLCSEKNLLSLITSLNETRRRTNCSIARQRYLTRRTLMELVELITYHFGNKKNNKHDKDDYQGRISGSLAWRLARHETNINTHSAHVWQIPGDLKSVKLFYTAASDEYALIDIDGKILEKKNGWMKGIYEMEGGIFRKVENDWKMVYLARSPEYDIGKIKWNFEMTDVKYEIKNFNFRAITSVFHDAKIDWKVQGFYRNGKTKVISINDSKEFETDQLNGVYKIELSAILSGGEKDLAWQHAQLFRQSLNAKEHSMEIILSLKKNN